MNNNASAGQVFLIGFIAGIAFTFIIIKIIGKEYLI
jgi:hypothetical protein